MDVNATNPIRVARKARGWTLRYMAKQANVHVQALYLNECGCYPAILPSITRCLIFELKCQSEQIDKAYDYFIHHKRKVSGEEFSLSTKRIDDLGEPEYHPFIQFRQALGLSRMGFAKNFCVQPTILYNLEEAKSVSIPKQVQEALRESNLPIIVLDELRTRYEDWKNNRV